FAGVLPLGDVPSGAIDLVGRFAELIDRLQTAVDALGITQPISDWTAAIAEAADSLTATTDWNEWQRTELQRLLNDLVQEATAEDRGATTTELSLAEVRL